MKKENKVTQSVAILIIFRLLSKILGFIRESLIGSKFGASRETDAFFMALSIIALFQSVLGAAINTTLIPVLSEIEHKEGIVEKRRHLNIFLNTIGVLAIALSFVGYLIAPLLLKFMARGFDDSEFEFLLLLTRVGIPALLLGSVQGIFRGYLQSEGSFLESALSEFPFNLTYIAFLLTATKTFGIVGLMVVNSLAVFSTILLQIPELKRLNFNFQFLIDFKDKYMVKTFKLMPPILFSVAINDVNQMIDRAMASVLPEGSISALNFGGKLNSFMVGIFVSAIVTVIYPLLSKAINQNNIKAFKNAIISGINMILLIMVPATFGLMILATPIVKLAFERGLFDALATEMTAGALIFYAFGSAFASSKLVLIRAFYSLQETKIALINSIYTLVLNVIFNFIFIRFIGHRGLALATSMAAILTFFALFIRLRKQIGAFGISGLLKSTSKIVLAGAIMGIIVFGLWQIIPPIFGSGTIREALSLTTVVGSGAMIYFILIYFLRVPEFNEIIDKLKVKLIKK